MEQSPDILRSDCSLLKPRNHSGCSALRLRSLQRGITIVDSSQSKVVEIPQHSQVENEGKHQKATDAVYVLRNLSSNS